MRENGFGHHAAGAIVSFGGVHRIRSLDFPCDELRRIDAEVIRTEYPECPMSGEAFRKTLDPAAIVQNRGPQKPESDKAIARHDGITAAQMA